MIIKKLEGWPVWAWLVLLLCVAAILRLINLGRESMWFDEAHSYLIASLPAADILNNSAQSSHPPLYYFLLHFWLQWIPHTDTAIRLLGLLWNLGLIPVIYWLALELFSERRLALLTAGLATIAPFHVLYSHELRMYTQLMTLVALGTFAYLRARRTGSGFWWLLYVLAFLGAIYTHFFAFFALGAIGLYALIHHQHRSALWLTVLSGLFLVVVFTPWISMMVAEPDKKLGSLRPLNQDSNLDITKPLSILLVLIFGLINNLLHNAMALFLTFSVIAVFIMEVRKAWRANPPPGLLLPVLMVICILGGPLLVYFSKPFFLPERSLAAASPFIFILLAWGTTRRQSPLPYLVFGTVVLMVVGTLLYLTGPLVKPPYRTVMQFIAQNRLANEAVLHTSDGSYLPALRYANFPQHALLAGDPDARRPRSVYHMFGGQVWTLKQAGQAGERLWLIVALEHSFDWQLKQAEYFARRYPMLKHYNIAGIDLYLYDLTTPAVDEESARHPELNPGN